MLTEKDHKLVDSLLYGNAFDNTNLSKKSETDNCAAEEMTLESLTEQELLQLNQRIKESIEESAHNFEEIKVELHKQGYLVMMDEWYLFGLQVLQRRLLNEYNQRITKNKG